MKILILYHSGVGNTKLVATKMQAFFLGCGQTVECCNVETAATQLVDAQYDGIIFGFPTYHSAPSKPILRYLEQAQPLKKPCPIFAYTTCGLYSANSVRAFCKRAMGKQFVPVHSASYRCIATDGVLLTPNIKRFSSHEKKLEEKIEKDCATFLALLKNAVYTAKIPHFKLYSILNYPNQKLGQATTFSIYLHEKTCTRCGKCVRECGEKAIIKGEDGFPVVQKEKCENCYRCIHFCPTKSLSLSQKKPPEKTLGAHYGS